MTGKKAPDTAAGPGATPRCTDERATSTGVSPKNTRAGDQSTRITSLAPAASAGSIMLSAEGGPMTMETAAPAVVRSAAGRSAAAPTGTARRAGATSSAAPQPT